MRRIPLWAALTATVMIGLSVTPTSALADPAPDDGAPGQTTPSDTTQAVPGEAATSEATRPHIVATTKHNGRDRLRIFSPAMNREVIVEVAHPAGSAPRPTIYLLDGAEAHDEESGWYAMTDLQRLGNAQPVNVVTPVGDAHSYYTDWRAVDPGIGKKFMYETFLTSELPPLIDAQYAGNGNNAIAGASMGGLAALTLTARHPSLYRGVAGYSDCANVSSLPNQLLTQWDVNRGGGDVANMWGPVGDAAWREHDPYLLAERLRGKTIYMSSGNGIPGKYNNLLSDPIDETLKGMIGEFGSWSCTGQMSTRLSTLGIAYTTNLRPTGTHKWGYWNDELAASWPMLMRAIGA